MNGLNIADNIVRLRHDKKITQEQLAEFIGVTKASVSKWENSQSTPDITLLPRLATFFDVTVDELIGYTPQLSKEQIQKLYQKFGEKFGECPFEEVMSETQEYVRRYYSCYPFLLQICILWLNHCKMAEGEERQKEICLSIDRLCGHIKSNCKDMRIHGNAVVLQTLVYFQLGRIQEVVDELESFSVSNRFGSQSSVLLAQAYTMLGNHEKAEGIAQISMYDNILNLLANAVCYLLIHTEHLSVCEETIVRIEKMAEIYKLADLNPNNLASFEYQAAVCYLTHGETKKALKHLDQYVMCLCNLFSSAELRLHGDEYFNRLEEWFDKELDNGTNAPRSRKVVLEDAKKTLEAAPFTILNGEPAFEKMKNKLKELS
ncbi:MAG: helix-turn-helix transcriptional regulator [Lachnospiraceae bacterium]|nr:helix-turn-helix transcriptional regulator [Lachnospiraceae bacterium]